MGYWYFDDSYYDNKDELSFALGAFVFCEEDINKRICNILEEEGLNPRTDEIKSSTFFKEEKRKKLQQARDKCINLCQSLCKIALVITPYKDKKELINHAMICFSKIVEENKLNESHDIFFDQSLVTKEQEKSINSHYNKTLPTVKLHYECDSKKIRGIQVADIIAHNFAKLIKIELGILDTKDLSCDEEKITLEFFLSNLTRYCYFLNENYQTTIENPMYSNSGLYIASNLNDQLKKAVNKHFKTIYLGCIH